MSFPTNTNRRGYNGGNTQQSMRAKAYKRGYETGRAGNQNESAPYMVSPLTDNLIREWTAGRAAGFQDFQKDERLRALQANLEGRAKEKRRGWSRDWPT